MYEHFTFIKTSLPGVWVAERKYFEDERGTFGRLFCKEEFQKIGFNKQIIQMNHSVTKIKGTVRGLHFQYKPFEEIKIITCLRGQVFDVAVDLRKKSETFLKWHGEILSEQNRKSLILPEGVAHGFQTLCDECELIYMHTNCYVKEAEGGLNVKDPKLLIEWPLQIKNLSEKDKNFKFIGELKI
jgi:dTDP-4-dehydrorhamnose 3,5-epimerase